MRRRFVATGSIAIAIGVGLLTSSAQARTSLPRLLGMSPTNWSGTLAVRPAEISSTGDGAGVLGGFDGSDGSHPGHLHWPIWTRNEAWGKGAVWVNNCSPNCASGTFSAYAVKVHAFRAVSEVFTRLTLFYNYRRKAVVDRRTLSRVGNSWQYRNLAP